MPGFIPVVFLLTYAGVALGRVPGLTLDRTGIALLGAIAMVASGAVPLDRALAGIDLPTILLLYALMVVSAQLRLGGFYTWAALRVTGFMDRPRLFLAACMGISALFSALLANDIVCLAFTPVLALALIEAGLNPVPFLLGLAISSNIGSAATLIGNPQNMLIGQVGQLGFGRFFLWCAPPSALALAGSFLFLCRAYRGRLRASGSAAPQTGERPDWPAFDRWQSTKGLLAVAALVVLFLTPLPRELTALAAAGLLLCSRRMQARHMLELVDWHLITLFCALFVVIAGIESTGRPAEIVRELGERGMDLRNVEALTGISALLSNLVSNVPATMLLVRFLDPADPLPWYVLALSSTYAGNLIVIGSIANLIVIEQAGRCGVRISFAEHARTGIPVTLLSLAMLIGWIWAFRWIFG